jgi:hypothetical protein
MGDLHDAESNEPVHEMTFQSQQLTPIIKDGIKCVVSLFFVFSPLCL